MSNQNLIEKLDNELISLCESKGLTGEEIFIIGTMTGTQEVIDRLGEETAILMAIEVIKLCGNDSEQIFYAVERALGIR